MTERSPFLSQFKNDVKTKQRLIRESLGTTGRPRGSDEDVSKFSRSKETIPSMDNEERDEHLQRQYQTNRYSYFQDEAEASLQFFKKNLLPSSNQRNVETNRSLFDKPTNRSAIETRTPASNSTSVNKPKYRDHNDREDRSYIQETITAAKNLSSRVETASPRYPSTKEHQPTEINGQSSAIPKAVEQPAELSSKFTNEKNRSDQVVILRPKPKPPRNKSVERSADLDRGETPEFELKRSNTIDGRRSTEQPSTPSGSFSRKPLYNSLIRAHDSIRLKVNRPKMRPKSEGPPVEDTVVDDDIPLQDIGNSDSNVHEKPIDVKRGSSRRKKKQDADTDIDEKVPVRNFSEVRIIKVVRSETERSLGVTVGAQGGNIVVARIMAGGLADKQGALQVGDIILSVNNREVYTPEQLQEELRRTSLEDSVIMKIVPSYREELPNLCLYLRALFNYDANKDNLLPCKELGVSFNQGDILEVVNQEDPNWWQARRVETENFQTGLIPSQELEERRQAFVIPDYDLATKTSVCGTKVSRKSKKREIYNLGQNNDFDKAELSLYEEVCRTPAFERRTLVLVGANGVGKQGLKARLVDSDPDRFSSPLPHTSRLPREGEVNGLHYHFVTRERMEEDIMAGKYLEYGEYDGALYGTKLDSVREIIGSSKVCVLDCSATCLKMLKTADYLPFVAFIAAPTVDQLRYMQNNRTYGAFDRAMSRQSRRAKTLQDFAYDFFEDEDLQITVEESARLFRVYENYFDIVLVNNNFEQTFEQLKEAIDALSMAPQWIPISWIYGT